MIDREITALLAYAAKLDSRVRRTLDTPEQAARTIGDWTSALAHVPATAPDVSWDASHAIRRYYEQRDGDRSATYRAVEPYVVLTAWSTKAGDLLDRHTDPIPAVDPDDPRAYRAELAVTRAAVAAGRIPPAQHQDAINPAGQDRLAALLPGVGKRYIPADVAGQLAVFRPTRAAREAAVAAGQPDPYAYACTWCGAEPDQSCRTGVRRHDKGRGTRSTPHPCRTDAARRAAGGRR
ncbi:hypothetical protein CTZ27_26240 [Streptomyces griseocarneus]|nr:hypothetical protein CTZ27_26240 [Streptomyces griseocarneus]